MKSVIEVPKVDVNDDLARVKKLAADIVIDLLSEDMRAATDKLKEATDRLITVFTRILPSIADIVVCTVRNVKICLVECAGELHPNKRLLQIALHGKNRRIRKKNEDRLLRWLAGYEVEEGAGNDG